MILWAKVEQRSTGLALVAFRRELVQTPRGVIMEDTPVFVVEGVAGIEDWAGKGVQLDFQVSKPGEQIIVSAQLLLSTQVPVDPVMPGKNTAFGKDTSVPVTPKKEATTTARGMGWKAQCKPRPAPVPQAVVNKSRVNRGGGRGR